MASSNEATRKLKKPPQLTAKEAYTLLTETFQFIEPSSTTLEDVALFQELDSYDDRNYLVAIRGRGKFVLKLHNGVDSEDADFIEAQVQALKLLRLEKIPAPYDVCSSRSFRLKDQTFVGRVLEYVEGTLLSEVPATRTLDRALGKFLGELDSALEKFHHPSLTSRELLWDLAKLAELRPLAEACLRGPRRESALRVLDEYDASFDELNKNLRRSVLQNDANDRNLLVRPGETFAVLDFGDVIETWTASELSIALAYVLVGVCGRGVEETEAFESDWLGRCREVFLGYHEAHPMTPSERDAVFLLMRGRLATSATIGAYSASKDPDNPYLLLHSEPAWRALEAMEKVGRARFQRQVVSLVE